MRVTIRCAGCNAGLPVDAATAPASIRCGRCKREITLKMSAAIAEDRTVDACPTCGGADFYRRKDFDPKLGLTVVIVGALISAAFYWFGMDLVAYSVLGGAALIDLIVYQRLGDLTVCYRCHTEFRGRYEPTAPGFDLHTADVLEQEYERAIGRR